MKVSLHIYPGRSVDDIINVVKFLDENNWHCVYLSDHFMHHKNHVNNGPMVECWTGLSAIALSTKNIKVSSFVSPISFRHPGVLTNMATTVDEISKGRLILGVGAGWQDNEHDAYGFDLSTPKNRVDRLEEGIQCIQGLLNNDYFSFKGKNFEFKNATCWPKKYKNSIPIMIGCWSGNRRMLEIGRKYGDVINLIGGADQLFYKIKYDIKDSNAFKNVLNHIFLIDDITRPIFEKFNDDPKDKFKPNVFGNYALMSYSILQKQIKIYKSMGFDEIILGDMSRLKNEDLFIVLNHIKNIIENES